MRPLLLGLFAIIICLSGFAQKQQVIKNLPAVRTTQKIVIDGDLNDLAWKTAPMATDFVEWRPSYGKIEKKENRTEVYVLYDNNAIYIGGFCHEASNDSISTELVGRDVVGVNDFVGVLFDTYNDKINGFGYYVTPLGEQYDAKYSNTGEDGSWNSVYESKAKIVKGGWTFEMRIPYSAIRFSNSKKQDWGINITRRRSKSGIQLMWNPTDPTIGGNFFAQFGIWKDIQDIKLPVRLSISPYFSTYVNNYPYNDPTLKNTTTLVNGGMDVKYGINQAFTLDMTLVPDFGQVQSDNHVLNLTPFEVKYNENRTFFTEGTDLFSKGNLFYSRRIAGMPIHYYDAYNELNPGETISSNPENSRIINATKVSGRTSTGLGIGVFNALTAPQYATVEYNGKDIRKIETDPLTNYNIVVFDQSLKHNSSVSFINTNVTRGGSNYNANVTAALWDLYDKKNNWNLSGKLAESQLFSYLPGGKNEDGHDHTLAVSKTGGRFNLNIWEELSDNKYSNNDMGYQTNNNFYDHGFWMGYKWLKPKGWYNNIYANVNGSLSMRFKPWDYQNLWLNMNVNSQLKSLWVVGGGFNFYATQNDFYEPRIAGRVFRRPEYAYYGLWFQSNNAKKYSASGQLYRNRSAKYGSDGYDISFGNQFRFNKKLTISTNSNLSLRTNNLGFATLVGDSSIFALRKVTTLENIFTVKYNFNNKMGLSIRTRHYWSLVNNTQYFTLTQDGGIIANPTNYNSVANYNVNYFNVDLLYTWQFALGSFINIAWKNAIGTQDTNTAGNYLKNLNNTLTAPQLNSISLQVIYFLDYLSVRKKHA